jgi:hypothetical protein
MKPQIFHPFRFEMNSTIILTQLTPQPILGPSIPCHFCQPITGNPILCKKLTILYIEDSDPLILSTLIYFDIIILSRIFAIKISRYHIIHIFNTSYRYRGHINRDCKSRMTIIVSMHGARYDIMIFPFISKRKRQTL